MQKVPGFQNRGFCAAKNGEKTNPIVLCRCDEAAAGRACVAGFHAGCAGIVQRVAGRFVNQKVRGLELVLLTGCALGDDILGGIDDLPEVFALERRLRDAGQVARGGVSDSRRADRGGLLKCVSLQPSS